MVITYINSKILRKYFLTAIFNFILTVIIFGQSIDVPTSSDEKYLYIVQRAVDSLLENAVDKFGNQKSGMILSVLNPRNGNPLELEDLFYSRHNMYNFHTSIYRDSSIWPRAPFGVRKGDRTGLGGSNANLQQDLYRTMEYLSEISGNPIYVNASNKALKDFMQITQHPKTGLLAWGEHLYWDCYEDRITNKGAMTHEPKRKFIFFDYLYSACSNNTLKYAYGLWDHQIADKTTGNFSRHAKYDRHAPEKDFDFPKEGSYFIDTWSRAFEKTNDIEFLRAINVISNRYLSRTNKLGLLDFDSSGTPERINKCTTLWLLSLAIEADDAIDRVDKETASILNKVVSEMDKGFLSLGHNLTELGEGFVMYAYTNTGKARPDESKNSNGYSRYWSMGYGVNLTSMFGLLAYRRNQQLKTGDLADHYKKLVIQAANGYQLNKPKPYKEDIWSGEYGMAIFLQLAAYRLTDNNLYLHGAQNLADEAINIFWKDGAYVLPVASSMTDYYDCITYSDTLLLSLLALHEHMLGGDITIDISDINR